MTAVTRWARKPRPVAAVQWTGPGTDRTALAAVIGRTDLRDCTYIGDDFQLGALHGYVWAAPGDWFVAVGGGLVEVFDDAAFREEFDPLAGDQ